MSSTITKLKLLKRIFDMRIAKDFGLGFHMPYKYIFSLTNKCDSRCKTCRIWELYKDNPTLAESELTLEEYEKIFEGIKKDVFWLNFSGGEPFLRDDLTDLLKLAKRKFYNLILFTVPTNGLDSDRIVEKTKTILETLEDKIRVIITVSIDGSEEVNDFTRGKGAYEKAIRTYKQLKEFEKDFKTFQVKVQSTLNKYNIGKIDEFIRRFGNSAVYTFAQESEYFNNMKTGSNIRDINKKFVMRDIEAIENSFRTNNIDDFLYGVYLKIAKKYYSENSERQILPCYATYATATVDCYGNVIPCAYYSVRVGNLRKCDYSLKTLFKSRKMKAFRDSIKAGKCPGCWTNCDGLPTLIQNFPISFIKSSI